MSRHNRERRASRVAAKPICDYCPNPRAKRIFVGDPETGTAQLAAGLCEGCFEKLKEYDPWTAEWFRYGTFVELPS